jgi:hypothetical protein
LSFAANDVGDVAAIEATCVWSRFDKIVPPGSTGSLDNIINHGGLLSAFRVWGRVLGRRTVLRWMGRNRRLAKDLEAAIDSARVFLYAASVMLLVRRITRA